MGTALPMSLLAYCCALGVLGCVMGQHYSEVPVCLNGLPAQLKDDHYCCERFGVLYCCKSDDPYDCHIMPVTGLPEKYKARADTSSRKESSKQNSSCDEKIGGAHGKSDEKSKKPAKDETCDKPVLRRTAVSTLRQLADPSRLGIPKLTHLTLTQSEGCETPSQMLVRLSGVEPGHEYKIMIGDNKACGAKNNKHWELGRIRMDGQSGTATVDSAVEELKDLKGLPISLIIDGKSDTFACGTIAYL